MERDNSQEKPYMDKLMETSNTYIQWPSRMKIGAKTKKDLYVRVYGHNPDDVNEAKAQILADFGPHRDLRITLKMEISYTDHSHLIGCRGATIRRVMEDTGCHIHFPDSNRMSKDHKSNQVTIAGSSVQAVEQARSRVRELSPLLFQFMLPIVNPTYEVNPDAHHVFIENIQSNYNVQVTIHPPNKLQQTSVTVKGCEIDAAKIKDAISKIVRYFSGGTMVNNLKVESTMEISAAQHSFVRSVNDTNIHSIMMNTGANIIFPDLSDTNIQQIKRSRVYVNGDISCVYNARQQLIGCLPLRMIFDLADDFPLDWEAVRMIGSELNVNVKLINRNRASGDRGGPGAASLPPPIPGRGRTIQLIAAERNTANIYEARRRILGAMEPPASVSIPSAYALRPTVTAGNTYQYGNRLTAPPGPLPPLMLPPSPNMLSPVLSPSFWPPSPYASPFCSPPIATCIVNNGSGGTGGGITPGDPPPGLTKMHGMSYNLHSSHGNHSYGFSSNLSTPSGPTPEFSLATMNAMKQSMHLPLMDNHSIKGFPTPASSTVSDSSMCSNPINAIIQEFRDFDLKRKAPGWERSNTAPNLFGKATSGASSSNNGSIISEGSVSVDPVETVKTPNPLNDKKYMAVKAMYNAKIGPNPRVPNPEWSGCGFSRTHLSLFPQNECNTARAGIDGGDSKTSINDDEKPSSSGVSWTDANNTNGEGSTNVGNTTSSKTKDCTSIHKPPLGHQQSNLLDFSASRTTIDRKLTDLPSLFIENGLEKYIHLFMSEEIDLESFAALTEADLRALGVSSYPARKKMHLLITGLNCSQADPKDNWD
ncbi:Protein bicaudal C 1 [Orchesella cincta]|uniref:Protein bicaudal C 1 n=1 Tax=Orchesella cincta TaxID=48709 RepID=A0A1D2MXL3_ORCCI|nr:Protein bicaudal C 1 [Orchesella cincta]